MPAGDLENPVRLTRYRRHDRLTDWSLLGVIMGFSKAIRLRNILCFTMLGFVCIVGQAAAQVPGLRCGHPCMLLKNIWKRPEKG